MLNASAPFSAVSIAAPQAGAARAAAPAFSYDAAVAALERQSARSLDIHGGQPKTAVTAGRASSAVESAPAPESAHPRQNKAESSTAKGENRAEAPLIATQSQIAPSPKPVPDAASLAASVATAPPSPSPLQTSAPAAAGARDAAAGIRNDGLRAPAIARTPASAVKQFAEVLAQRLDNASQFDLRLDPPALGSVEGRLTLSDDGGAVLSLSFDNQSAFDLFRRDEGALRFALADAGFDLAGRNLQFSFREPAGTVAPDAAANSESTFATPAPFHRGAVDIRA